MTALIVIAAILLFFSLILIMPIHVVVGMDGKAEIYLRILCFRMAIYPAAKKQKPAKKKKPEKPKEKQPAKKKTDISKMIKIFSDTLPVLLDGLGKHLKIRLKRYDIRIGTGEAAKTAMLCGAAEQASAYIMSLLYCESRFAVSKRCVPRVTPDFVTEKCSVNIKIVFTMNPAGIISTFVPTLKAFRQAAAENSGAAES